jgi:hypothetical protein
MITFQEMLDTVERVADQLKAAEEVDSAIRHALENMRGLRSMLEYAHQKDFKTRAEALRYIDKVLTPQLNGIIDALHSATGESISRLQTAEESARRLALRLQIMINDSGTDLLP